jgi:hypothetical protein
MNHLDLFSGIGGFALNAYYFNFSFGNRGRWGGIVGILINS